MANQIEIDTEKYTGSKHDFKIRLFIAALVSIIYCLSTLANIGIDKTRGREVIIKSDSGIIKASVSVEDMDIDFLNDRIYSCYFQNKIYCTQGEIVGKPLNGKFSRYDIHDNLLESGYYMSGLKAGIWKKFSIDGFLTETCQYRGGLPDGRRIIYKDGKPDISEKYRMGKIIGKPINLNSVNESTNTGNRNSRFKKKTNKNKDYTEPGNNIDDSAHTFTNPEKTVEDARK